MYPGTWAARTPAKPAAIHAGTGAVLTFAELDARSNQLAHLLRKRGLAIGDHLALLMDNRLAFYVVAWAAFRSGLYVTCVNRYLTAPEAAYIVDDCDAKAVISCGALGDLAGALPALCPDVAMWLAFDGDVAGYEAADPLLALQPAGPVADETMGDSMLYSSGTTGRPKGILRPLTGKAADSGLRTMPNLAARYGFDQHTVYLSPAPLYHAAPLGFNLGTQGWGGTVVMMDRFDPVRALELIEQYRVTHSQWVPTMFVRMLKLPPADRVGHDLTSHRCAVHAAAPCPVAVKQQMIDWWGPILYEYYAGTEGNGSTFIDSHDWLAHPGSVGRPNNCELRICDEAGAVQPTGEDGLVYFVQAERSYRYHKAPDKTASSAHPRHPNWTTLGDVGHVDAEGYLYLTDRQAFMIVSGGVNVYPQQVEDALIVHPAVADVAVFGIPDEDLGEAVHAVVELAPGRAGDAALAADLITFVRERLARYMVPKAIEFTDALPRLPTGKLYKRVLRDAYRGTAGATIV